MVLSHRVGLVMCAIRRRRVHLAKLLTRRCVLVFQNGHARYCAYPITVKVAHITGFKQGMHHVVESSERGLGRSGDEEEDKQGEESLFIDCKDV